jgi:hypothetical protein
MATNPILDELSAARAKLLADAGGDVDRLLAGIREREAESIRHSAAAEVPTTDKSWLEQISGTISDDAAFLEALEMGRALRQADCAQDESGR